GSVVSATPGTADNSVAATVTIDPSTLGGIVITPRAGTDNTVQEIAINAIGGTFTLSYGGGTTAPLAYNAPAVTVENAIEGLPGINNVKVSQNGTVYDVIFQDPTSSVAVLTANASNLRPRALHPEDLVGFTIEITKGPAKNKTRIIKGAVAAGPNWVLTLDKQWLSPFTGDASVPDATSKYTLHDTNPNLLVDQAAQSNLLFLYDTDNPASYNDAALPASHTNPFGQGQIFFDATPFGPADADGIVKALNQFRITGFGMGANRCIGGPSDPVGIEDVDANACNGPVGANEPGGITFKSITNLEINLGPGRNHFTIKDTPAGTLTRVNMGRGDDLVDIKKVHGHTFVNGGAGSDTFNVHNDQQKLSDIAALLTLSGDSPQANVVSLANGSPQQGTAILAVNSIQRLTIEATGGSFVLTYAPTPLGLSASQAFDAGTL